MKHRSIIAAAIVVAVFFTAQAFISVNVSETEKQSYEVLRSFEDFEIREYAPAVYYKVKMDNESYRKGANSGFRTLADYIFGGNENNERIAMTSPVTTDLGEDPVMKFAAPRAYERASLPRPNNEAVQFEEEGTKIVAAIRFSGRANDKMIEDHRQKLVEALAQEGIAHKGKFSFLGYNPPYELINRRNEVIVELEDYPQE